MSEQGRASDFTHSGHFASQARKPQPWEEERGVWDYPTHHGPRWANSPRNDRRQEHPLPYDPAVEFPGTQVRGVNQGSNTSDNFSEDACQINKKH